MNRDDSTFYKLDLTQDEFYQLRAVLSSAPPNRQLDSHLIELFDEAERKANNPYLLEARRLVESFYLGLQNISQRQSDIFNPVVSNRQPVVRLAVAQDVLQDEEAATYLADNIPSGLVDWFIVPSRFDFYPSSSESCSSLTDPEPRQVCLDFRAPSSIHLEHDIEEPEKRGFFEE